MERYPDVWKDACLEMLRAQREAMRQHLGRKVLGWDSIRNAIMRPYDEYLNGTLFKQSELLIRQNLEKWDSDESISDEKFRYVDDYIRALAKTGQDSAALDIVRSNRFEIEATILARMYAPRAAEARNGPFAMRDCGWSLHLKGGNEDWFGDMFFKPTRRHKNGIIQIICTYLWSTSSRRVLDYGLDMVFFDGYLIPMETFDLKSEGSPARRTIFLLRLLRPEFLGAAGVGYADGELEVLEVDGHESGTPQVAFHISASGSPTLPGFGQGFGLLGDPIEMRQSLTEKVSQSAQVYKKGRAMQQATSDHIKRLDDIIENNYKGYV